MIKYLGLVTILVTVWACKTQQSIIDTVEYEERFLDTMVVLPEPLLADEDELYSRAIFRESATQKFDLLHTRLEVSFDWEKQHVLGNAQLRLKPWFYPTDELVLDAKGFDIHSISMASLDLKYDYDGLQLKIDLGREFTRDEDLTLEIEYTAKPNEKEEGGSSAIMSDKGLFFINPKKENPNKPQQIWTQGETESNSNWFPTIDKPNERCSQEIYVTVDEKFKTLSNGLLISSSSNGDGTRTDYWKQEKPHAPYLFMLGIGDYAIVKDTWKGMELLYYVEPEFKQDAEVIFGHTPEMLTFFSELLGVEYPWDKYAQIVCKDYVSGAMENTSAVIFGDFVQKSTKELQDYNNDDIVAHEMFHHWFGDLVTCESWSNLTLQEGMATYSELLWQEYKYGKDAMEVNRLNDLAGYIQSVSGGEGHNLIDHQYNDKEDMFDAHSYNKGGLVFHMLRSYLGDAAFFAGLKKYLEDNAYSDVEAHEMRLAFEDVSGEDLNWFFDQWFFDKGHPELAVTWVQDGEGLYIDVEQNQDPEYNVPVYYLPVTSKVYLASGEIIEAPLIIDQDMKTFEIAIPDGKEVVSVVFDGNHDLLAIIDREWTDKELFHLYQHSDEYIDKTHAIRLIEDSNMKDQVIEQALKESSRELRAFGVNHADKNVHLFALTNIAENDQWGVLRGSALKLLGDASLAVKALDLQRSYSEMSAALNVLATTDKSLAIKQADKIYSGGNYRPMTNQLASIFGGSEDAQYMKFFDENLAKTNIYTFFPILTQYMKLAEYANSEQKIELANRLKSIALDESNIYFKKYAAVNSLVTLSDSNEKEEGLNMELSNILIETIQKSRDGRIKDNFSSITKP